MHYPFDKIQKLHNEINNESIFLLANQLQGAFPDLINASAHKTRRIKDTPTKIPVSDIWINDDILQITVMNLAVLKMTNNTSQHFAHMLLKWANDKGDKGDVNFIRHLVKWAKYEDDLYTSIVNLTHLAYYEATIRKHRPLGAGNVILPGERECLLISQLAYALVSTIGNNHKRLIYRPDSEVEYNRVVTRGDIDFLVDDSLYIVRLHDVEKADLYYMLISYVLIKQSPKYKDVDIKYVRLVNLSLGTCCTLDIGNVQPMALTVVMDSMYGPTPQWVVETVLMRKRRAALVTGIVSLREAKNRDSVIQQTASICSAYAPVQMEETEDPHVKESFLAVVVYFSQSSTKCDAEGVNLLNQLFVDIENMGQVDKKTVRLSEELSQDILRKALDF